MLSCHLNIYVYNQIFASLNCGFLCSWQKFMQRFLTSQSAKNKWLLSVETWRGHLYTSSACSSRSLRFRKHWRANVRTGSWEDSCEMPSSGPAMVTALMNSQVPYLLNTKSSQSTFHHCLGNGSWVTVPCWGAIGSLWLLGESFFLGEVAAEMGCSYSGWFYAHVHVGSIY